MHCTTSSMAKKELQLEVKIFFIRKAVPLKSDPSMPPKFSLMDRSGSRTCQPQVCHFGERFFFELTVICKPGHKFVKVSALSSLGFLGDSDSKESACKAGGLGLIPGLGRSPGGGHGNPLQYSCLENPHGQRSLAGYSPWGHKKSETTE